VKHQPIIPLTILAALFFFSSVSAHYLPPARRTFTRQDTLRGSVTPERSWWDLTYYHLNIAVSPSDSTIHGTNTVTYRVIKSADVMQIDLQEPLILTGAVQNGKALRIVKEDNLFWIHLIDKQEPGKIYTVVLNYGGKPKVS
jgi:hypothetical protein